MRVSFTVSSIAVLFFFAFSGCAPQPIPTADPSAKDKLLAGRTAATDSEQAEKSPAKVDNTRGPSCPLITAGDLGVKDIPLKKVPILTSFFDEKIQFCKTAKNHELCKQMVGCAHRHKMGGTCPELAQLCDKVLEEGVDEADDILKTACLFPCLSIRNAAACRKGCEVNGEACRMMGKITLAGKGEEPDIAAAVDWWAKGCDRGDFLSCSLAAGYLKNGEGVKRDVPRAMDLYEKGCAEGKGDPIACTMWGVYPRFGYDAQPKDWPLAAKLFEWSCDGGYGLGCYFLGEMHFGGAGVPRDDVKALALFQRACGASGQYNQTGAGCKYLGEYHRDGLGGAKQDRCYEHKSYELGCESGDRGSCGRLGSAYLLGTIVPKDDKKAFELFKKGCDAKDDRSCLSLADAYQEGWGVPKDRQKGTEIKTGLCEKGLGNVCAIVGESLVKGDEEQKKQAVEFFEKGCGFGSDFACMDLAGSYSAGSGVPRNLEKAAALYKKVCDKGVSRACYYYATSLEWGTGTKKDEKKAAALYRKVCEQDDGRACGALASMLESGKGVAPDLDEAEALWKKSCEQKFNRSGWGCYRYGVQQMYGVDAPQNLLDGASAFMSSCSDKLPSGCLQVGLAYLTGINVQKPNPVKAEEKFKLAFDGFSKACRNGSAYSCGICALMHERGRGTMKDEEAAAAHYEKMRTLAEDKCAEGKARECASLGWFYLGGKATRPDYKKAAEYSQKACKLGNYLACGNLGEQYEHGLGVKKNPGKAFRFCKKGCDSGSGYACARLGQMHEFGKGTRKNQARARSLYEKSCRLGSAEGCALVEIDKTGPAGISETECASKPTACWKLGLQHIFARGTQRDLVKGTELLRTACSNGEWRACDLAIDFGEMP